MNDQKLSGTLLLYLTTGAFGACTFHYLGVPAAYLSGPMLAIGLLGIVLPQSIKGEVQRLPACINQPVLMLIGAAMGTAVEPSLLEGAATWPLTIVGLLLVVVAISGTVLMYVSRLWGWSKEEAFFSGLPGALGMTAALAQERGTPMERIMVVQLVRLFLLLAVLPWILQGVWGSDEASKAVQTVSAPAPAMDYVQLSVALGLCAAASGMASRLKLPAGPMTGAFLMSALLNVTALVSFYLPSWLTVPCYVLLGTSVGMGLGRISLSDLKPLLRVSLSVFAISISISFAGALAVSQLFAVPLDAAFLAYAPGGMEAVFLLTVMLGADPVLVATHQLARYIGLMLLLPVFSKFILDKQRDRASGRHSKQVPCSNSPK